MEQRMSDTLPGHEDDIAGRIIMMTAQLDQGSALLADAQIRLNNGTKILQALIGLRQLWIQRAGQLRTPPAIGPRYLAEPAFIAEAKAEVYARCAEQLRGAVASVVTE
jgi:hypothetical protein